MSNPAFAGTDPVELLDRLSNYVKTPIDWSFARKEFLRQVTAGRKPYLPGLCDVFTEEADLGTTVIGRIELDRLKKSDVEQYRAWENIDVTSAFYGGEAARFFYSSMMGLSDKHEHLFSKKVAGELNQRVRKHGKATLVDLGVGAAEEVAHILGLIRPERRKNITVYGIDSNFPMLVKSNVINRKNVRMIDFPYDRMMKLSDRMSNAKEPQKSKLFCEFYKTLEPSQQIMFNHLPSVLIQERLLRDLNIEYHPVEADMKALPFEDMDAVFTLNTNTKGNLTKNDWETVDGKIAKAMSRKAVLFEDVYGPPPEDSLKSYGMAKAYSLHPGFRAASGLIYSDNFKKYVLNSGPTYFVYNELTDSVEVFKASFDLVKDLWNVMPLMRSHRFTYEEVKYQAKSAGLNCRIFRDSTEPFYVVEMKKL